VTDSAKNGDRRPVFPISLEILIFIFLVLVTALALRPLRNFIQAQTAAIRDEYLGRAEELLGLKIRYASLGPSIFGTLDIRDLSFWDKDDIPEGDTAAVPGSGQIPPLLRISRLRIYWSFREFLRGNSLSVRTIRIDYPVINFSSDRHEDTVKTLLRFLEYADIPDLDYLLAMLPDRIRLGIRGGGINAVLGGGRLKARGFTFDTVIRDRQIDFRGKWKLDLSLTGIPGGPFNAGMRNRVRGSYDAKTDGGQGELHIPALSGDLFRVRHLGFALELKDGTFRLRGIPGSGVTAAAPVPKNAGLADFYLEYGLASRLFSGRWNFDDFSPGNFVSLSGGWKDYNPLLALRISGGAFADGKAGEGVKYRINLGGAVPETLPLGTTTFELEARGDEKTVYFERASVNLVRKNGTGILPRGRFGYQGSISFDPPAPNGVLTVSGFSFTGTKEISAEIGIYTEGREISIFSETVTLGDLVLTALDGRAVFSAEDIHFVLSALHFSGMETYEEVKLGSFSLEGTMEYTPRQIEASFMLDSFSVDNMAEMIRPFVGDPDMSPLMRSIGNDLLVTTEIFFTTDFQHLLYNIPRLVVAYEGSAEIVALLSVSGTDRRFNLSDGRILWSGGRFDLNGFADFANPMDVSFSMMINYQNFSWFFEGQALDRRSVSIQGSYGLKIYTGMTGAGGYSGYVQAEDVPVPIRGQFARLSLSSAFRYDSSTFWSVDMDRFELLDISTPFSPAASFSLAGRADQEGLRIPRIFFDDGGGALRGQARASWPEDFSGFSGTLTLEEENGEERYFLEGSLEEYRLELFLSLSRIRLGRLIPNARDAVADGFVSLTREPGGPFEADIRLLSLEARIREKELRASASAWTDGEVFRLEGLDLRYADTEVLVPRLGIDLARGTAETSVTVRGKPLGRELALDFSADAAFRPLESWLEFRKTLSSFSGGIHVSGGRLDTVFIDEPFDFEFSRRQSRFSLSGGPKNMIRFNFSETGEFYAGLSNPLPIRGSVTGTIHSGTIDARTTDLYVDLAALWRILPLPGDREVILNGGYATASVQIRGPLGDPEFFGSARGNSVRVRVVNFVTEDIRPVPFTVQIEGNGMSFGPVPASVGKGRGTIAGWFRFDRWIPNIFSIDFLVSPETSVPFGFDIAGFLASGDASGHLNLAMEDTVLDVTGDLTVHNTEISLNGEEIALAQNIDIFEESIVPVAVNLNVAAGKKVEFVWPNTRMPILQAYADRGTTVNVTADSLSRRFAITSDVKIRSGEIFYFERSFYIREGTVVFRENESQFDPRITIRAEVRDRTDEGPVTISLIIDNAPLLSFTPRFEATPPLSQMEIFSLLGQNLTGTPEGSDGAIQRAFVNSTTDILAQFSIVRRVERQIRDFLRLDMFSLRTQLLQNAVFRATGLQSPVDRTGGVGNYFDNTTVFLGKYIGRDMFVQSMLSMRYDKNNRDLGGLTFEPDIGIELHSPLFDIRWDFMPLHPERMMANPEKMFIVGNSFTLTWRKSF
jgi:hypothetical protein